MDGFNVVQPDFIEPEVLLDIEPYVCITKININLGFRQCKYITNSRVTVPYYFAKIPFLTRSRFTSQPYVYTIIIYLIII